MDVADYNRVMKLFDAACELPRREQQQYVARLATSDPALGMRLSQMLAHDANETEVLGRGAGIQALTQAVGEDARAVAAGTRRRREGQQVGAYVVGDWLGQGSMGSVYRGHALEGHQLVAIKFLKACDDDVQIARLRREFEVLCQLNHSGCVRVFAHGRSADDHYLVMEFVGGGDLSVRVGMPNRETLRLVTGTAQALAHIHQRGIIHRDLKPANVLLTDAAVPQAVLVDFGIAKPPDATTLLTGSNELLGSLDFLAPEQCRGQHAEIRSDLYALGCLIYVLWSGEAPFGGDNIERLEGRMRRRPRPLDQLQAATPPALTELVQALMSPLPNDRPATAAVVTTQLHAITESL